MKKWRLAFLIALSASGAAASASGDGSAPEKAGAESTAKKGGSQTELKFEELLVQGKYHFADEAVVTVEEDKVLDTLLGQRMDFKDRLKKSASRQ